MQAIDMKIRRKMTGVSEKASNLVGVVTQNKKGASGEGKGRVCWPSPWL